MNRENNNSETGAIMVEAAIYFPITIGIVMGGIFPGKENCWKSRKKERSG